MTDWRAAAACRDDDGEFWFPVGDGPDARAQAKYAVSVCNRCPVAAACLTWAMDNGADHGVWGGMTAQQRHRAKRRASRARAREAS